MTTRTNELSPAGFAADVTEHTSERNDQGKRQAEEEYADKSDNERKDACRVGCRQRKTSETGEH